jgi:hypothetical protein
MGIWYSLDRVRARWIEVSGYDTQSSECVGGRNVPDRGVDSRESQDGEEVPCGPDWTLDMQI